MLAYERTLWALGVLGLTGTVICQIVISAHTGHTVRGLKQDMERMERNVLNIAVETGLADVFELKSPKIEDAP